MKNRTVYATVGLLTAGFCLMAVVTSVRAEPFAAGIFRKVDGRVDKAQVTGIVVTFPGGQSRDCVIAQSYGSGYHSLGAPALAITCDWP